MKGQAMCMKLDPKMSKYAIELYLNYASYVENDGYLYMVMFKVMYGCVQASVLWDKNIHSELEKMEYEVSAMDPCMFVKQVGNGKIFMLMLYVDDILAIVDEAEAKQLNFHLTTKYGTM